ncbi:MAG: hypothetical protein ABI720_07785 [Actinomycetes bacterium]
MTDEKSEARKRTLELLMVIVLSSTTILTAWSGFQSSKWGGAMSISFAQASTARIEASRFDQTANSRAALQVGLWTAWLQQSQSDPKLADFLEQRFPEPLATAQADWLETNPEKNPDAPDSPFAMPAYLLPEREAAVAADARADAKYAEALANNQRGDNYTILTVLFATVLFFTAMSGRVRETRSQVALLSLAVVLGTVGIVFLTAFPKLV